MNDAKEKLLFVLTGAWAVIAPVHTIMYAVLFLVAVNLVTGIWRARVTKTPLTWRRAFESVGKLFGYTLAVLACFSIDKIVAATDPTVARIAGASISLLEITSIASNLKAVGIDVLSGVIDWLQNLAKKKE